MFFFYGIFFLLKYVKKIIAVTIQDGLFLLN